MRFRFSSLLGVSIPVVVLLGGTFHFFMFEFFLGGLMRSAGMEYSFVVKESVDIKRFEKILKLNDICLSVEAADDIEGMEFLFGNPMREPLCVKIPIEKILGFSFPHSQCFGGQAVLSEDWNKIPHTFKTDDTKILFTFLYGTMWTNDIDAFSICEDKVVLNSTKSSGFIYFFLQQRAIEKVKHAIVSSSK